MDRLDAAQAGDADGQLPGVTQLCSLHADLGVGAGGTAGLRGLADRMRRVAVVPQPLAVDLRIADRVVLPEQAAAEVVAAVDVLSRLMPDPVGRSEWRGYRARFVERYGMSTVVPLAQLIDPLTGLGYPEHFSTAAGVPPAPLSRRDERLLALAQQAVIDGVREVVLDDAAVAALAEAGHDGGHVSTPH